MELLWLGHPDCHRVDRVGGKVAPLSRLAAAYRVPPGFCLATSAYDSWRGEERNGAGEPPPWLLDELIAAYGRLAEQCDMAEPAVAVRSSAVDEDGAATSFAGQYATYLNLSGPHAIADAVLRCWDSAVGDRIMAYRNQHGIAADNIRLAVLVQQLVVAAASGVAFSANPVTGDGDEVVINACWGLGESVVSGTVTPDTYVVHKPDLTLKTRNVSRKERMTVAVPGGTKEVAVPRLLSQEPALTDEQVVEMAQLAISLEKQMGYPVDVECAFQGDDLYLLQCRQITTLP